MYFDPFARLIVDRLRYTRMWFTTLDSTSYVLILCLLVIFTVFAFVVFASLPGCSCRYLFILNECFKIRSHRVADSSRRHVIGSDMIDRRPQYPGAPLALNSTQVRITNDERLEGANLSPFESSRSLGVTMLTLNPFNLRYSGGGRHKEGWDEAPPSYDSLFPIVHVSSISKDVEIKMVPIHPAQEL